MPEVIKELIELIRNERKVFIKTANYVPAHITATDKTIGQDWSEDRMRDYLHGEAMLNYNYGGPLSKGETVSIFIGEAGYHAWVRHYRVSKAVINDKWNGTFTWELVK
jgi:hypothetical protein